MWRVFHFDFGISWQSPTENVTDLIRRVWPPTLQLGVITITFAYATGLLFGIVAAVRQNSWIDQVVTLFATSGITVPRFVIATWLVLLFAVRLRVLPQEDGMNPSTSSCPCWPTV